MGLLLNEITLWETAGIRCVSIHRQIAPALFEIAVLYRGSALTRRTFERHEEAAEFAIACMHKSLSFWEPLLRAASRGNADGQASQSL
jgi:hypothetical protein